MTVVDDHPRRQGASAQSQESLPRLLVVEDDRSTCIAIGKLAEKAGYAVTIAGSVEEAVKLLRSESYDCITLDLMLGKDCGVPLVQTIAESIPSTPVIIVSGSPDGMRSVAASLGKVTQLNIVETLTKPIDFARLRALLVAVKEKSVAGPCPPAAQRLRAQAERCMQLARQTTDGSLAEALIKLASTSEAEADDLEQRTPWRTRPKAS